MPEEIGAFAAVDVPEAMQNKASVCQNHIKQLNVLEVLKYYTTYHR